MTEKALNWGLAYSFSGLVIIFMAASTVAHVALESS